MSIPPIRTRPPPDPRIVVGPHYFETDEAWERYLAYVKRSLRRNSR